MKHVHRHPLAVLSLIVATSLAVCGLVAHASVDERPVLPTVQAPALPSPGPAIPALVPLDNRDNDRQEHLSAYVLDVMQGWTHAPEAVPTADYGSVASDLAAAVILEPTPPQPMIPCSLMPSPDGFKRCLWGVDGWNSDHAKTVLLAAITYWEGARYAAYVDRGDCNSAAWRADPANAKLLHLGGNCDGGRAHSLGQVHPIVDVASPLYPLCNERALDDSRLGAMRCVLELARRSLTTNGTLSYYTGEMSFEHPKADQRLDFAARALSKHPFKPLGSE